MLDKSVLKQADIPTLIETALECGRQQAGILACPDALDEEQITRLQEIESVREYVLRLIDWDAVRNLDGCMQQLRQLQKQDADNRHLMETRRDEMLRQVELLRKRRNVAGEYLNFR